MADLKRLFEDLDRLDMSASWSEVKRRRPGAPLSEPGRPRRIVEVVVAFAVAAAGISLALRAFVLEPDQPAAPPTLAGSDILEVPPRGEVDAEFLADGHPVFVVHHEDGPVSVIDAFSTHRPWGLEELVGWCPLSRTFDESAHGAKFNEYGEYLVGPASADLASYEVEPADGRVRVRSAVVPTTRSEDAQVGFQGELCGPAAGPLLLHRIPSTAAFDSPAAAVEAGAEGWIALQGVLLVRAGEPALLCATFEDGSCTSPARVEGIDSGAWLDFLHRSQASLESWWITRVEGDHITSLTRAVAAGPTPTPTAGPGTLVPVPDLVGLERAEGVRILEEVGLAVQIEARGTRTLPPGTILDQQPAAGTSVEPGTTVTLVEARDLYPRGYFEWCPAVGGALPVGPDSADDAEQVALRFSRAFLTGEWEAVRRLLDASAIPLRRGSWAVVGEPETVAVLGSGVGSEGPGVSYGCGPSVAARTWTVTIDDGTDSASLDFVLYLVRRASGWKVWASY